MSIYGTEQTDYHVHADDREKISNKPCDVNAHWLMVVSKHTSNQIVIGKSRFDNNLKHQIQPSAPTWFRPK